MYAGLASFACSLVSPSTPADKGWGHLCFAEMYLYCIRIFFIAFVFVHVFVFGDWYPKAFWLTRALDLLVLERCIFWQILRLRKGCQVFRRNDGFSVVVNVNIRMSSSLAFDKRVSDVGLYTFPGEHRWAGSNAWCFTRSYIIQYYTVLSQVWDSELRHWHSRN